jgi:hypothetical protein
LPAPGLPVIASLNDDAFNQSALQAVLYRFIERCGYKTQYTHMKTCESCGRVRFYSLNFIFSKTVCNECYLALQERKKR